MNILITGVGGPTPRSIARSLKRLSKFKDAKIIGTDINPLAYGLQEQDLYETTYLIPRADEADYWSVIEEIVQRHNIDLALVHPEKEVEAWSERLAKGEDLPVPTLLPNVALTRLLVDKSLMTAVLKDSALVPTSFDIDPENLDIEALEATLPYPFWIRATAGSSGLGSLKIEDRQSLKTWIHINPGVRKFIASAFLPGRNLACKLLFWQGKLVRSATGERVNYIMSNVAPSGITGNTSFGRLLNEPALVDEALKAMEILFAASGAPKHGFFTADFKEDQDGKPYLTEINVRMVAFNYSFAQGGANFSEDIVQLLSNPAEFDMEYKQYLFESGTIFLRDVDTEPLLMKEQDLPKRIL